MITNETVRKVRQAHDLLAEAREDLKAYGDELPGYGGLTDPHGFEKGERRARQGDAIDAVNATLSNLRTAMPLIAAIWERLGKPQAQQAPRITWMRGQYADHRGAVGGVEAFAIHWHTYREDPNYFTESRLPGLRLAEKHDDLDVLKAACEAAFSAWLARMGGGS